MNVLQASLLRVVPILASYNIDETEAFYTQKLGFRTISKYTDFGYLIVERDGVTPHFTRVGQGSPATTATSCYMYVQGVDALYQQAVAAAVVHPNGKLENKSWGLREFVIEDGDGNLFRVGETLA